MSNLKYISSIVLVIFVISATISSQDVSRRRQKTNNEDPVEGSFDRPNRLLFSATTTPTEPFEYETTTNKPIIDPSDNEIMKSHFEELERHGFWSTTTVSSNLNKDFSEDIENEEEEEDSEIESDSDPNKPPIMIKIPSTRAEITRKQADRGFENHPGLAAALAATLDKRSPKNAYILCIGQAGAGKSSTINFLFGRSLTLVGNTDSTTTKGIFEYAANISLPHLGIQNSQLRIIDTPGLGSASGVDYDARILATLNNYLKNHEDLKHALPNVVLVFSKFDDNRFQGPSSTFVKMLKGYNMIKETLFPSTDKPSNIIFVMTRFTGETRKVTKNPKEKLEIFRSVIGNRNYTEFPEPIIITVAENAAEESDLPQVGDNYKLPNKELYPQNLIDRILKNISSTPGTIEHEIFEAALANRTTIDIQEIYSGGILDRENEKAKEALVQIQTLDFTIEPSEVAEALKEANDKIDPDLKKSYPASLQLIQRAFQTMKIKDKSQIPTKRSELAKFLQGSHLNPAMVEIFQKAFSIEIPEYEFALVVGHGYDVLADTPIENTPFNLEDLRFSKLGFMIPDGITAEPVNNEEVNILNFYKDANEYKDERLRELGIQDEINEDSYTAEFNSGNNVIDPASKTQEILIKSKREIRKFHLTLNERISFNQEFQDSLREMPQFNISSRDSVSEWEHIFQKYGTHIVASAYGGGEIETMASIKGDELENLRKGVTANVKNAIMKLPQNSEYKQGLEENSNFEFNIHLKGGDHKFQRLNLAEMPLNEIVKNVEQWKETLGYEAIILKSKLLLLPLSEVVKPLNDSLAIEMQKAMTALFQGTLLYVAPPTSATSTKTEFESSVPVPDPVDNEDLDILKLLNENFEKNLEVARAQQAEKDEELLRRLRAMMTTTTTTTTSTTARPYHRPVRTTTTTTKPKSDRHWAVRAGEYVMRTITSIPDKLVEVKNKLRNLFQDIFEGKYTEEELSEENIKKLVNLTIKAATAFPTFKGPGFSYDLMHDRLLQISPFQNIDALFITYCVAPTEKAVFISEAYADMGDYIKYRTQQTTNSKIMVSKSHFDGTILPGYSTGHLSTIVKEYREWNVRLNTQQLNRLSLTKEFEQMLRDLPRYYASSCSSTNSWKKLFNTFGTHIVSNAYMGGAIEYAPTGKYLTEIRSLNQYQMPNYMRTVRLEETKGWNYRVIGGDSEIIFDKANAASQRMNLWETSVKTHPVMLPTDIKLYPIYRIIGQWRSALYQDAISAFNDYVEGKLVACDRNIQCGPSGVAINDFCDCPDDQRNVGNQCKTMAGNECSLESWDNCVPNSLCTKDKKTNRGTCTCRNRFVANSIGLCFKAAGDSCQKSIKCNWPASFGCIAGKCHCMLGSTYDHKQKACLGKIGDRCGESIYDGIKYFVRCVTGAFCDWGVCRKVQSKY